MDAYCGWTLREPRCLDRTAVLTSATVTRLDLSLLAAEQWLLSQAPPAAAVAPQHLQRCGDRLRLERLILSLPALTSLTVDGLDFRR